MCAGGKPGARGLSYLVEASGRIINLGGKASVSCHAGVSKAQAKRSSWSSKFVLSGARPGKKSCLVKIILPTLEHKHCLFFACLSVCLSVSMFLPICLPACLSVYWSVSICIFACLLVCLFVSGRYLLFLSVCLCLSVCPSFCLSAYWSVCLPVY